MANQPAKQFRLGFVTATVWLNAKHYNTVLSKTYRDGDEWKNTDQLSTGRWSARSKRSAGPASTVPCAISRTRVLGLPIYVLLRRMKILSCVGSCLVVPTSSNAWAWPNGSPRPAGP
jgi:hypothetical protein